MAWLSQAMTGGTNARDHETRAALLHALSTRRAASFEMANSLNRERQGLSNTALAYLALTFANLDRPELAGEVLGILGPRAKTETAAPGRPPRLYWDRIEPVGLAPRPRRDHRAGAPGLRAGPARRRPSSTQAIDWLQAHRSGHGWQPAQGQGPGPRRPGARTHGRAPGSRGPVPADRHGQRHPGLPSSTSHGAAEGQAIAVPAKALKAGDSNRVGFAIEGRGTFGYAVTLTGFTRDFGPDQDQANRPARVDRRVYWPRPRSSTARSLPTGFGVAVNPTTFENTVSQVGAGRQGPRGSAPSGGTSPRTRPSGSATSWSSRSTCPPGTTLIEGSVQSSASSYTLADGVLTFYFAPDQNPGGIQYDVYGYLPGQYRDLAGLGPQRLRAGPVPPRASPATSRSSPRASRTPTRTSPRPTSSTPAARPTSTPAGSPRPPRPRAALRRATPSATTSPRTPRGCSS